MANDFEKILDTAGKFSTISLEEMDEVRLMNRTDTKYVFHSGRLPGILEKARDLYRILSINDRSVFSYNSLYFDSEDLRTYLDHHNGIRPRYKVRFREYEDTGEIYLEVKKKIANDRTRKSRTLVGKIEHNLTERSMEYIGRRTPLDPDGLKPSMWTNFRRITLVRNGKSERITIDVDISFRYLDMMKNLPYLCICEVKRESDCGRTDFMQILKGERLYPGKNSKYCLGTVLLKKGIKYNRFKSSILNINKIENAYKFSPVAG